MPAASRACRTVLASVVAVLACAAAPSRAAPDANRLTYLDGGDPYYVGRGFARLTTPQWVGEPGVEAVVVFGIDDMGTPEPYEAYLRPILERLKRIDGRAPVSIMTNRLDPEHAQLAAWLKEGVSLETHTFDHPCPLLAGFDFDKAKSTYDRCVDLLARVPGSRPVAFRMPCCDSLNTPSPRFYAEMFNRLTPGRNFLTIDTSVFNITTPKDASLPRELVIDPDGREKFRKYVPFPSFVNTIEDYPYPYVIGGLCWEFPCATPSDWQAQNLHKPDNPQTVADWNALIDLTVLKQGTLNLVFHPHNWIKPQQVVEMIDHAVAKHGRKVKFLTFREAQERLDAHALAGQPLRAANGQENGVRLLDVNGDGFMDVVIGNEHVKMTRVWSPTEGKWQETPLPVSLVTTDGAGNRFDAGARFGIIDDRGAACLIIRNGTDAGGWRFADGVWAADESLLAGFGDDVFTGRAGLDRGVRLRDLDHDGRCELVVSNEQRQAVFARPPDGKGWAELPFSLPRDVAIVDASGADRGLRFVDVDEDGDEDVLFSNQDRYSLHLFTSMAEGWSQRVRAGRRGEGGDNEIPMVVNGRTNNGAWFHSRTMWVQNETTAGLPNLVDRRSFAKLLEGVLPGPRSPEQALKTFKLRSGYHIELMAAEPLVADPVAFQWGPDGKLWVAEMGDYPRGVDGQGAPGGVIRYLEDVDGDGTYDKSTVFLDKLGFPTGVTPWRKGVIVTAAPDIFYAEDTDGDGGADKREVLFTGFAEGNQQHRVNGLVYGLDNWLYGANGDSGGRITSTKTGKSVDIGGRDFRINPDTGEIDPTSGQAQFGRARDDWGNWFGCNNSFPSWQYVLDDRYVRRNPHVAAPSPTHQVSEVPGPAPIFPVSKTLERFNEPHSANRFTSANGLMIYRDELFGSGMRGNTFVSEPVHNLVHREHVWQAGVLFRSRRIDDEANAEFLASTDTWFRPTQLRTGPDGAVWVADMYRLVIEHPEWIPPDWQAKLDLRAGHDKGRLYRVVKSDRTPRPIPRLDSMPPGALVLALNSPSGWQRDMCQQLIVQSGDRSVVPVLEKMATKGDRALTRLHALCTLDGLGPVRPAVLIAALADPAPGVRQNAVRICERQFVHAPELGPAVAKLAGDPDPLVRLQVACSLGEWKDPKAGEALAAIALRDADEPYIQAAVLSSVTAENLPAVFAGTAKGTPPAALTANLLRVAAATGNDPAIGHAIEEIVTRDDADLAQQFVALAELLDALEQGGSSLAALRDRSPALAESVAKLSDLFDAAREATIDDAAAPELRIAAAALLGRGVEDQAGDADLLAGVLTPQTPEPVQVVAIGSLSRIPGEAGAAALIDAWKGMTPALRSQSLEALLRREERLPLLLDAMEAGTVRAVDFDAARRRQLVEHDDETVRARAAKLFAGSVNPDRQKVIDEFSAALEMPGDAGRGREFFKAICAACHKVGDLGANVGPDLLALSDRSPEYYLAHILDPNRAVEAKYVNYVAQTKGGQTFAGVLTGETGNSVTLAGPTGEPQMILRTDLKRLQATALSAMPEGLEAGRTPQDFADLLAFLTGSGTPPAPKVFPGNRPALIKPAADGTLHLLAGSAEIYGASLVYEPPNANLGWWSGIDDHAVWEVETPQAGAYDVVLEFACDDASAGNAFVLRAAKARLTGKVPGTGGWEQYRTEKVGRIELPAGKQRVVFRSDGPINNALIDLKSIRLIPAKD
jgi:putative membrane-bound dehydrogenase-like protein